MNPTEFSRNFYHWYIKGLSRNSSFPEKEDEINQLKVYTTENFYNSISRIVNETDADPIILAQDIIDSWPEDIKASIQLYENNKAIVTILIGNTSTLHKLCAHLMQYKSTWKLDGVSKKC